MVRCDPAGEVPSTARRTEPRHALHGHADPQTVATWMNRSDDAILEPMETECHAIAPHAQVANLELVSLAGQLGPIDADFACERVNLDAER